MHNEPDFTDVIKRAKALERQAEDQGLDSYTIAALIVADQLSRVLQRRIAKDRD